MYEECIKTQSLISSAYIYASIVRGQFIYKNNPNKIIDEYILTKIERDKNMPYNEKGSFRLFYL